MAAADLTTPDLTAWCCARLLVRPPLDIPTDVYARLDGQADLIRRIEAAPQSDRRQLLADDPDLLRAALAADPTAEPPPPQKTTTLADIADLYRDAVWDWDRHIVRGILHLLGGASGE